MDFSSNSEHGSESKASTHKPRGKRNPKSTQNKESKATGKRKREESSPTSTQGQPPESTQDSEMEDIAYADDEFEDDTAPSYESLGFGQLGQSWDNLERLVALENKSVEETMAEDSQSWDNLEQLVAEGNKSAEETNAKEARKNDQERVQTELARGARPQASVAVAWWVMTWHPSPSPLPGGSNASCVACGWVTMPSSVAAPLGWPSLGLDRQKKEALDKARVQLLLWDSSKSFKCSGMLTVH